MSRISLGRCLPLLKVRAGEVTLYRSLGVVAHHALARAEAEARGQDVAF